MKLASATPRYAKNDAPNFVESDYGQPDAPPKAEKSVRVRVKRDRTVGATLPSGERLHLVGDGTVYELPESVAKQLVDSVEPVADAADLSAGDALVATLVAEARKPGAFERLMGKVRAKIGED